MIDADHDSGKPAIVTDDGGPRTPTKRPDARWYLLAVGFILGFGAAVLFGGSTTVEPIDEALATQSTEPINPGIGEQILGFPDSLNLVVAPGEGRAYEVWTWPNRGEQIRRSIPLSDLTAWGEIEFDASGQFLAGFVSTGRDQLLLMGRPNTVTVAGTGVNGFAWHDADSADLAWSTIIDDEFQLWLSENAARPELVATRDDIVGSLQAFGDWGYAVAETVGEEEHRVITRILNPNGEPIESHDGAVLASHDSGLLLMSESSEDVRLIGPDGEISFDTRNFTGRIVTAGAFSPSGDRVALLGLFSVEVYTVEGEKLFSDSSLRAGGAQIDWSSDGQFLALPGFTGAQIIDLESGESTSVLEGQTIRSLSALPIRGS